MPALFRALEHRNFRLYAFGQGVSLIGTWLQRVAMGWLAYRLSGSVWLLGLVGFCSQAAFFFIAPFAGILGDRGDKKKLITAIQYFMLVQALVLSLLAWSGLIEAWHLVVLASTLGVAAAFDAPLRQAMLMDLVGDKADLSNAIALNSLLVNLARVAGPAFAGLIVAAFNEAVCFMLNTLSFVAIIIALSRIRWPEAPKPAQKASYRRAFVEGVSYAFRQETIRNSLFLVAAVAWCISPYVTLMPVFVSKVLGGDARILGNLLSAAGAGTVLGTLYLASCRSTDGLRNVIAFSAALSGAAMCLFSWSSTVLPASFLLSLVGGGMMVAAAGTNTILQLVSAADHMRGRVASFYIMAFVGVGPFGTLAGATLADLIGVRATFFLNGMLCCLAALWFKAKAADGS